MSTVLGEASEQVSLLQRSTIEFRDGVLHHRHIRRFPDCNVFSLLAHLIFDSIFLFLVGRTALGARLIESPLPRRPRAIRSSIYSGRLR